ncbi:DNA-binding GntR family transcriptional regulator [Methylobacterium sp. PvP062]|uniref:Transcriptional regulator, GntR family n=2 Tax=Methylobacterium radiotolerans TaxID=31998 RepID=B1M8P6_METRJ|nr:MULTISPECIES: GntR family transcriptional regulator [Methylobacterium]MCX7333664.1 GntR family transcriptional regulator [Hyphomicrobiales bacterium]ACB27871.1 transcriptional regulator, GntR family [Methylobacterium radiotolerans JCM 2831]KIU28946.1 GntR family transcriptional regulator [Methylobacterium radiotolerans]KTS06745.1 GntR family transcriptional regulator [Methylobacterium radiotolerans]KTS48629.1 GntR family transcriptional regulator [Methylobacterium radiotolerans]
MLLRDNIYAAIRADILACVLRPGAEVREQELAQRYAVSRQPVREALLRLERERLVTVHARQGYQINAISVADARDLLRMRLALEPACAAEAAAGAPDSVVASLDAFRTVADGADFIAENRAFHIALAEASGNRRMAATVRDLVEQADRLVRVSLDGIRGRDPAQLVDEHAAIIDAVQRRDGRGARRLVRAHVAQAERRILTALERSAIVL